MQNIQQISMDFSVHGIPPRVYGKQDDSGSRFVAISLYNSGAAIALESDALFAMRYKTAQGAYGLYDTLPDGTSAFSLSGNTVTVQLVDQIFSAPGRVECELRIIDSTSGISTWTFYVEVEGSNVGDTLIPSDYINVFSNIAAAVAADADRAEAAASSIDTSALMRADEYDPNNVVRANGGIPAYISTAAIPIGQKGVANGVAPLNSSGTLDGAYFPNELKYVNRTSTEATIVNDLSLPIDSASIEIAKIGRLVICEGNIVATGDGIKNMIYADLGRIFPVAAFGLHDVPGIASTSGEIMICLPKFTESGTSLATIRVLIYRSDLSSFLEASTYSVRFAFSYIAKI